MAHPPLLQQRLPMTTTSASHHQHKPISTNATFKKKKEKEKTQLERSAQPQILNPSTPSQISNPQHHPKIPNHGKMVASEIKETQTARHSGVLAILVLDVGDDDGSCAASGELASRILTHAVCAFGDNGHLALELII